MLQLAEGKSGNALLAEITLERFESGDGLDKTTIFLADVIFSVTNESAVTPRPNCSEHKQSFKQCMNRRSIFQIPG